MAHRVHQCRIDESAHGISGRPFFHDHRSDPCVEGTDVEQCLSRVSQRLARGVVKIGFEKDERWPGMDAASDSPTTT